MENNLCDDVEYRYSESSQMLYIGLANDDRYYKQPNPTMPALPAMLSGMLC